MWVFILSINSGLLLTVSKDQSKQQKEHAINMTRSDVVVMPPLAEKITVDPIVPSVENQSVASLGLNSQSPVSSFSVATLQQYTNSFAEENLLSKDKLSKVYLAELPDGKVKSTALLNTSLLFCSHFS